MHSTVNIHLNEYTHIKRTLSLTHVSNENLRLDLNTEWWNISGTSPFTGGEHNFSSNEKSTLKIYIMFGITRAHMNMTRFMCARAKVEEMSERFQ